MLWVAFAIVHIGVAVLGFVQPNQPMGDVTNVYEPWSTWAVEGRAIVGITETWVYPQLALVPMILAQGFEWIAGYEVAWAILTIICDALAFAVLVGNGRSAGRSTAAWFWLAFIALLGPVGMYRLDGITVPLALVGCLWLVGRPWLGSILLAVATWIKVWPAALLAAAVIAVRRRLAVAGGALIVSAVTLAAVFAAGGARHAFGFIGDQTDRGLQLEAPGERLLPVARRGGHPRFVHLLRPGSAHLPGRGPGGRRGDRRDDAAADPGRARALRPSAHTGHGGVPDS